MQQDIFDLQLFEEFYGGQPQAIVWVNPVWANDGKTIVDFNYAYSNQQGLEYLNVTLAEFSKLTVRTSSTLSATMRTEIYAEMLQVYETGRESATTVFNPVLKKFARVLRSKLRGGVLSVVVDITTEKNMIDQLMQQKASLEANTRALDQQQLKLEEVASTLKSVFDATQTGIVIFLPEYNDKNEIVDFRFNLVNATMSAYAKQPPDALIGTLGSKWFPEYFTNGLFDMCRNVYLSGKTQRKEIHYQADGLDNYLDLQSVRIGNRLLVCFTDHTNLRISQLQLQQTVRELEQSNRYLEDFAHAASHDMKEPLRKIITFAGQLKNNAAATAGGEYQHMLDRIEAAARHLNNFVTDLLNFSYISQKRLVKETVDLNDIVRVILSEFELIIAEKQVKVNTGHLPALQGNARQLEQLFYNLIGNALKYTTEQPVINIRCSLATAAMVAEKLPEQLNGKKYLLIEVTDNGIGFDQHYAEQIFAIFERLHTRAQYAGSGIGLSIARQVAVNHGGTIWANSQPGKGATFFVLLPAEDINVK